MASRIWSLAWLAFANRKRRKIQPMKYTAMSATALLFLACGYAHAEAIKDKGGQAYYLPVAPPEDTKQADGSIVRRVTFSGIIVADLPFPFDYGKHHCTGTTLISADGKPGRGHGYCEVLSTKGDRASFTYVGEGGAGQFT